MENQEKLIPVTRHRNTSYGFNEMKNGAVVHQWEWNAFTPTHEMPESTVKWLQYHSDAFKTGELVIVDDKGSEFAKTIMEDDNAKNNIHSEEQIRDILKMTNAKMTKELGKITDFQEKQFVLSIVKTMKNEFTVDRVTAIAEWVGIKPEFLFD